jgi:hypothetical protein
MNEGHVVDKVTEGFYDVTEMFAALSVLGETEWGFHPWSESILERFDWFAEVGRLPVMFFQLGLVVPEIHVAGGPAHEELNDSFCLWRVVQCLECGTCANGIREGLVVISAGLILEQHDSGCERCKLMSGIQNLSSRWNSEVLKHRDDSGLRKAAVVEELRLGNRFFGEMRGRVGSDCGLLLELYPIERPQASQNVFREI